MGTVIQKWTSSFILLKLLIVTLGDLKYNKTSPLPTLKHVLKSILHGIPRKVLSSELQNCYKKVADMDKDC